MSVLFRAIISINFKVTAILFIFSVWRAIPARYLFSVDEKMGMIKLQNLGKYILMIESVTHEHVS